MLKHHSLARHPGQRDSAGKLLAKHLGGSREEHSRGAAAIILTNLRPHSSQHYSTYIGTPQTWEWKATSGVVLFPESHARAAQRPINRARGTRGRYFRDRVKAGSQRLLWLFQTMSEDG
jgi:hypothetical protein